jgi:hypothetical protein
MCSKGALFPQRLPFPASTGKADALAEDFDPERRQLGIGDHHVCNVRIFRKLKPRLFGFQDFEALQEKNRSPVGVGIIGINRLRDDQMNRDVVKDRDYRDAASQMIFARGLRLSRPAYGGAQAA